MSLPNRNTTREIFFTVWRKHKEKLVLEALEAQLLDIILWHPEYHDMLDDPETYLNKDFAEHNPILHLSLHLAMQEQVNTNRPYGIQEIHHDLCEKLKDPHLAAHKMMECLGKILVSAQQSGKMPEEKVYLEALQKISV